MKLKTNRSLLMASALTMVLVPALTAVAPAQAAPAPTEPSVESIALEVYETLDAAPDPQLAFAELSAGERTAFEAYFLPVSTEVTVVLTPLDAASERASRSGAVASTYSSAEDASAAVAAVSGCWGTYSEATQSGSLGNAIWDTFNEGTWCANGTTVTSATFSRSWSSIAAVGWRDDGQIGKGAGVVSNKARIWSQRKMVLGSGGWDIQTIQPCNRFSGSSSGGATSDNVCSTL
ncbi:hypothetical protein EV379_2810 [Microterricola gilva]|uniref:Uncharacterized protein n=2 Tax=Microterricola gilva TaxID=393267 RepID=A0A4Q8AQQ2_9MICO|nr:hypothetical protein EV379_2810 [Microterricola gilva]